MNAIDLARDIAGTNNGYLFAPTGEQVKCARENPDKFTVAYGNETFPYRIKARSPMGVLAFCNIDQANDMLRGGYAGAREAHEYVEAWNAAGRLMVARVEYRTVGLPGVSIPLLAPFITLQNA
jgi:hypothetical protein